MAITDKKLKKGQLHQLPAIEIPQSQYVNVRFSDVEGYVIGSPAAPVEAGQITVDFTNALSGSWALIHHRSNTKPTYSNNITIIREMGVYLTGEVNPVTLLYLGGTNVIIIYANETSVVIDGRVKQGDIVFNNPTSVNITGFEWRISGNLNVSGTVMNKSTETDSPNIGGTPLVHPRIDILEGGINNDVYYINGIEAENQPFPAITEGRILLREIIRNPDGSNTVTPGEVDLSDYVNKSVGGVQTINSSLISVPLSGKPRTYITPDVNGMLVSSRGDVAGMFNTTQGQSGWSKIITVVTDSGQLDYPCICEFYGLSAKHEIGYLWITFTVDSSGEMITPKLQVFGDINTSKLIMVKTAAREFQILVSHDETNSYYKFRPVSHFGGISKYTYHHESVRGALPAGDQYSFTGFSYDQNNFVRVQYIDSNLLPGEGTPEERVLAYINANMTITKAATDSKWNLYVPGLDPMDPYDNGTFPYTLSLNLS